MNVLARKGGDEPHPPQPPTQSPNAPVEEPVREPGPEEPKKSVAHGS
jgi:hypothetical protein